MSARQHATGLTALGFPTAHPLGQSTLPRLFRQFNGQALAAAMIARRHPPSPARRGRDAPAMVYMAAHVPRVVPVPSGRHMVEPRTNPPPRIGLAIRLGTLFAAMARWGAHRYRERSVRPTRSAPR